MLSYLYAPFLLDSSEITITDGSVTFIPTTTSGSILCFSVLAIEDNTLEGDETVSLMLSADDDVAAISNSEVQLTIQDVLQERGILLFYGNICFFPS